MSTAQIGYFKFPKMVRTSPSPNATFYIPDTTHEGISYLDVRPFKKILIEVEADQPIGVRVQNTPSGNASDFKYLPSAFSIPSTSFDIESRNLITLDGAEACVGFIRLEIKTGSTAPSSIVVWIEVKD